MGRTRRKVNELSEQSGIPGVQISLHIRSPAFQALGAGGIPE